MYRLTADQINKIRGTFPNLDIKSEGQDCYNIPNIDPVKLKSLGIDPIADNMSIANSNKPQIPQVKNNNIPTQVTTPPAEESKKIADAISDVFGKMLGPTLFNITQVQANLTLLENKISQQISDMMENQKNSQNTTIQSIAKLETSLAENTSSQAACADRLNALIAVLKNIKI